MSGWRCVTSDESVDATATPVRIERRGRFVVARPLSEIPPMTSETVEQTRNRLRAERAAYGGRNKK